jgi:hypothetical protein
MTLMVCGLLSLRHFEPVFIPWRGGRSAPPQSDPLPPAGRRRRFIFRAIFGLVYRQARNRGIGEIEPR